MWGFFVSTTLLWHGTFSINSLAHWMGRGRYKTGDDSKNSLILALITGGEGWHNNHYYYQRSARNGFFWWEIDTTYYVLKAFSLVGLVWDLQVPTEKVLSGNHVEPMAKARELGARDLVAAAKAKIEPKMEEVAAAARAALDSSSSPVTSDAE